MATNKQEGIKEAASEYNSTEAVKLPNTESIPYYEITTTPRGYCIIIDNAANNTFGGDEENKKLTKCLEESLAFHVEHFTKLNTKSIHRLLQHLSKVDHSSYSCLMVIVLGRGRNGFVYDHDNKLIEFHKIMSYFTPDRCTTLEGKPKLFLFQTVDDGTESKEIRFHTELTDSYQAFCELSLSAILRNTSFVHKLFEDVVQNRGVVVDDVLKQKASLMTYSSLNGKKLFLPTLQNTNVTVKRERLFLELKMATEVWIPMRESIISDISSQENKDTLNKIANDNRKRKISGSSISIIGGLIAIIGFALISVTFAGSIVISVVGTFIALYGAVISVTATFVKFRLQKQILNEAKEAIVIDKELWEIVEKLVEKCNKISEETLGNFEKFNFEEISVIARNVFRTIAHLGIFTAQGGVQITRSGGLIATHTIRIASTALRTIAIVGIVTTILILPFDILELVYNAYRLYHSKESKIVLKINEITNELQKQLDKVQDELREREQEADGGMADKRELFTTQVSRELETVIAI